MKERCPQCGSSHHSVPNRLRGKLSHYTCRDAWHMPSLSEEAQAGLELSRAVDQVFGGDIELRLPAEVLAFDPTRVSTCGAPR